MDARRLLLFLLAGLGLAVRVAHATPTLRLDRELQGRLAALMENRAGTVLVYDMPSQRVLAVTDDALAFRSVRPPGSVMKLVTALTLYDQRDRVVRCTDHFSLGGRDFTCGVQGGHGRVDMRAAIVRSCSIWFYSVGQGLDPARLVAAGRRLGLGAASPFVAGRASTLRVPSTERARALMRVGEGDAVLVTPWDALQMAIRLHDATDPAGRYVYAAMHDVVTEGTGGGASLAGVDVRGKTGTATWLVPARPDAPPRTHGWFVCTAGRIAVVVFLQSGTGHDAAILAGQVLRACKGRL